jgi:hypothetical protein
MGRNAKARAITRIFREMAIKRKLVVFGYVLLLAALGLALDLGIVAMMLRS